VRKYGNGFHVDRRRRRTAAGARRRHLRHTARQIGKECRQAGVAAPPQRRRSVGPAIAADPAEGTPEPSLLDDLPAEPRRRIAIGLSPIDAPATTSELEDSDESVEEDFIDEAVTAPPVDPVPNEREPAAAFPAPREPEPALADPAPAAADLPEPAPLDSDEPPSILSQLKTKKKSAPGALAGASEGAVSAPMGPSEVEEVVSLVLVRQVPPRFDEEPRNWLGGLPMMPDDVEWPRSVAPERLDEGEVPLHFVAQISCADFPRICGAGSVLVRAGYCCSSTRTTARATTRACSGHPHFGAWQRTPAPRRFAPGRKRGKRRQRISLVRDRPTPSPRPGGAGRSTSSRSQRGPRQRLPDDRHAPEFLRQALRRRTGRIRCPDVTGMEPFSWRGALYVVDSVLRELGQPSPASRLAPAQREVLDNPAMSPRSCPSFGRVSKFG
jgi:hypothetical protein